MCVQILANLVMETLHPELRKVIGPRLKGKMQQRQRNWMLVSSYHTVHHRHAVQTRERLEPIAFFSSRSLMQCTGRCCLRPPVSMTHWSKPVRPREFHWTPGCEPTWTRSSRLKSTSAARYEVTKDLCNSLIFMAFGKLIFLF